MGAPFTRYLVGVIIVLLAITVFVNDTNAQKRRKRTRRVVTPPVVTEQASQTNEENSSDDPKIVSTADQTNSAKSAIQKPKPSPTPESEQEALRRTIVELSGEVNRLTEKVNQMQEQQRSLVDIERLNRLEQRAETLRAQLRDVQAKEAETQTQLDEIGYALQPENIERVVAMYGTTHPEVAREQRKKLLQNQQAKLREQYNQLEQSRVRLEAAVANADAEVESLRQRIEASGQQTNQPQSGTSGTDAPVPPQPKPPVEPPPL